MLFGTQPCYIKNVMEARGGKHGHAKRLMDGVGIFDGKSYSLLLTHGEDVEVPLVTLNELQVLDIMGRTVRMKDAQGNRHEINVKYEQHALAIQQNMITDEATLKALVLTTMGEEILVDVLPI